ncbi:MAG: hypothetical protein AAF492_03280 [Verrucomicrobiota bacterium]
MLGPVIAMFLVLTFANIRMGELNQDEGWYLYAAKNVAEGRMPYRDYAYTQAPILPLVYSLNHRFVAEGGIEAGRLFTGFLGIFAALLAGMLARRCVPRAWREVVFFLTFILITCNVYHSYFTTVVKTYSLCAFFLMGGLLCLSRAPGAVGWKAFVWAALSGVLLALAAGTRISSGIAMPIAFVYLFWRTKFSDWKPWFGFGFGGGLALLAIFLPFAISSYESFLFCVIQYHKERWIESGKFFVYKAGFISRFVQAYFLYCVLLVTYIFIFIFKLNPAKEPEETDVPKSLNGCLWAIAIGMSFVHFTAAFPYDDYQVVVFPVLCVALAVGFVRLVMSIPDETWARRTANGMVVVIFLGSVAASFSSPVNMTWIMEGRDRIFWKTKEQSDLKELREVARWLKERTEPGDVLLTQDTYLAIEAGLNVPDGFEMGPFCYFAEWEDEQARALKVPNEAAMKKLLQEAAPEYAAFSEYGLFLQCPEVKELPKEKQTELWELLNQKYEEVKVVPRFGQGYTTLRIYKRRS